MKINIAISKIDTFKTELLIVGMFEKEKPVKDLADLDKKLGGEITSLIRNKQFTGEFLQLQSISSLNKIPAKKVLLVGLGEKKEYTLELLRKASGLVAKATKKSGIKNFSSTLHLQEIRNVSLGKKTQAMTEGTLLGLYEFTDYKTVDRDKIKKIDSFTILDINKNNLKEIKRGMLLGKTVSEATNYVRDLVNFPACKATPGFMAAEAKKLAKNKAIKVKVYGKKDLERMKMNAILGVSRGSSQEPKLVVLDYNPSKKETIAIVGKGITFDSGGLDIKPEPYMLDMKSDMAGAATVLGTIKVVSKLEIPLRIIGLMPLTENMTGASAQKPGDIITAYNKKTIEVLNTDAEGRLILADALSFAEEFKPKAIIDLATLTGSCIVALGYSGAGLMGSDEKLIGKIKKAAEETQERVWELPLWDDFKEMVKGELADVRNLGKGKGYEAGTIAAAAFLQNFVKKTPWAHLDIAGTAWFVEEKEYQPKGATGYGVRLLTNLLQNWKK